VVLLVPRRYHKYSVVRTSIFADMKLNNKIHYITVTFKVLLPQLKVLGFSYYNMTIPPKSRETPLIHHPGTR